jgi:hypothetical protein
VKAHLRVALIALMLRACPLTLFAADANGWYEQDCEFTTFHITKVDSSPAGHVLVLVLRAPLNSLRYLTGNDWYDVLGKQCSGVGNCEYPTHSKIRLIKATGGGRRVLGSYSVDFFNGNHLEGQFVVKYREPKTMLICE